ncbi:flagellar basal body P-ring protein [Candidatus Magnetoovum chiemensis]|nr:flagellar basal body P-ring protein [Candidatus Magnetoovum chiemensis]
MISLKRKHKTGQKPMTGAAAIKKSFTLMSLIALFCCLTLNNAEAERIKDIASVKGIRENQVFGYGLVVGLNGTGDKKGATVQSLVNMFSRMGMAVDIKDIRSRNVAAVMVTAMLPPFPKIGNTMNANVATIGDAKSLQGGTLLMTPLKGANGDVYALAQGPLSVGGISAEGEGASVVVNHPTVGVVPDGVTIEKEITFDLANEDEITLIIRKPDFTSATNIKNAINKYLKDNYAYSPDPSSVKINVPQFYKGNVVDLIDKIETLDVAIDVPAKVVINERTGTVVIGDKVQISPVAISHGSLTINITEKPQQPVPFAPAGESETQLDVITKDVSLTEVSGSTLGEIVDGLNKLGVSPRDLIAILQSLKKAGALRAELEIM